MNEKKINLKFYKKQLIIILCLLVFVIACCVYLSVSNKKETVYTMSESTSQVNDYDDSTKNKTLKEWQQVNDDVVGLLKINNKEFPVVKSQDNQDYLNLSIYKNYDIFGVPFIDYQTDLDNYDNLIIYGHSTYNKDLVFTFIKEYLSGDFYKENAKFIYEDEKGSKTYQILAITEYNAEDVDKDMSWYKLSFKSLKDKELYITERLKNADRTFNNKINIKGDLITLITCNMSDTSKRYMLLASEMKEQNNSDPISANDIEGS